jgi:hypothetical protein
VTKAQSNRFSVTNARPFEKPSALASAATAMRGGLTGGTVPPLNSTVKTAFVCSHYAEPSTGHGVERAGEMRG